jgi:hypothetical protein
MNHEEIELNSTHHVNKYSVWSQKSCGKLALLPFRGIRSTMKLLGIFHVSNICETLRMWELDFSSKNSHIL